MEQAAATRPSPAPARPGRSPSGRARARLRRGLPDLGLLLVVTALMRSSQNAAQTTLPLLGHDVLGLSASAIGAIAAVSGAIGAAVMLLVASRVPASMSRAALAVSLLSMAASLVLFALAPGPVLFVVGAIVLGAAGGLAFPILITAAGTSGRSSSAAGSRDRPLVLLGLALSASLAVGPFVETAVLGAFGGNLRAAFWAFTPVLLVGAAISGLLARRGSKRRRDRVDRRLPGRDGGSGDEAKAHDPCSTGELDVSSIARRGRSVSIGQAWGSASFRVALVAQVMYAFPFVALVVFGALLSRHAYGMSPAGAELAFGTFFVSSFLVRGMMAWRSPIPHKVGLARGAAVLSIAGLVALGLGHGPAVLMAAMVVLGVPHGLTMPLASSLVADGRPARELPAVNSYMAAVVQAVTLSLPPVLGLAVGLAGYRATFMMLLLPVALCGGLLMLVSRSWRPVPQ